MRALFFFSFLSLFTLAGHAANNSFQKNDAIQNLTFKNKIRPFTSDGCSRFPDGTPGITPDQWLNCCVQHDVAYWQGGTKEQRADADKKLGECVANSGATFIGPVMRLGVRLGGYGDLPTTWNWGYGWTLYRGYGPLTQDEQNEVQLKYNTVNAHLTAQEIIDAPVLRERASITGDYCVDLGALEIQKRLQREFQIERILQSTQETATGFFHTFKVKTKECSEDFQFVVHTLKRHSCTSPMTELVARGQIRFLKISKNNTCH